MYKLGDNVLRKRAIQCGLNGKKKFFIPEGRWLDQQGDLE
jgi:hypothetical protein